MPTVKFQNRDNAPQAVEPGEYVAEVIGFEFKMTPKNGNDYCNLKWRECKSGAVFYDSLFFTDAAAWRIDTFLRASGLAPKVGEDLEFDEDFCQKRVVGARANVSLSKVEMDKKPGRFRNEIISYITNKPAPARAAKIAASDVKADW